MRVSSCIFAICMIVVFSTGCWAGTEDEMTAKKALSKDPKIARVAVQTLSKTKDSEALLGVVEKTRLHDVSVLAIKSLGDIKAVEHASTLVDFLRSANVAVVEGGSEQQAEHQQVKKALVIALANICDMEAPKKEDVDTISGFVSECEKKIRTMNDKPSSTDGKNPGK